MGVSSITCALPLMHTHKTQTKCSILMRTAAIATGIALLVIGLFILHDFACIQIGIISGWTLVGLGVAFVLSAMCLKSFREHSKKINKAIPTRHTIHSQAAAPTDCEILDKDAEGESYLESLPSEVLYVILDSLEAPQLLKLEMTSVAMYQKMASYFTFKFPLNALLADHSYTAIGINKIKTVENYNLFLELWEKNGFDKKEKKLSDERFWEILLILKEKNLLHLLNTFFEEQPPGRRHITRDSWKSFYITTPLHYWAFKGRLDFVKALIEHGAMDYLANTPSGGRSALSRAAEGGHIEVVDYLLKNGARPDIYFDDEDRSIGLLTHFIQRVGSGNKQRLPAIKCSIHHIECLKRILDYMAIYYPQQLRFQLHAECNNIIKWTECSEYSKNPLIKEMHEILKRYNGI